MKSSYILLLQSYCILLDVRIQKSQISEEIIHNILKLISKLPTNLAAMVFFGRLNVFLKTQSKLSLKILVSLLKKIEYEPLLLYAIKMLEKCPCTLR